MPKMIHTGDAMTLAEREAFAQAEADRQELARAEETSRATPAMRVFAGYDPNTRTATISPPVEEPREAEHPGT